MPAAAGLPASVAVVLDWMLGREILVEDRGIIAMGPAGEREYGRRNFMDVTSLFLTEPLLALRCSRSAVRGPLGAAPHRPVDSSSLASREDDRATILLTCRPAL